MRTWIPIGILACSVGFALGSGSSSVRPNASDELFLKGEETAIPLRKKAPGGEKKKKTPTAPEKPSAPEFEEPPESQGGPAQWDEAADCDDCVIVRNSQDGVIPAVEKSDGKNRAGDKAGSGSGWPLAMAKTLWGLFYVGRPRAVTGIRSVTVG